MIIQGDHGPVQLRGDAHMATLNAYSMPEADAAVEFLEFCNFYDTSNIYLATYIYLDTYLFMEEYRYEYPIANYDFSQTSNVE